MKTRFRAGNTTHRTIREFICEAALCFNEHGIDAPHITAEILLSHVLNMTQSQLYLADDRILSDTEAQSFDTLAARRLNREPLAYIIGEKGFWSLSFAVTPDVLIPRPDTECLVETALEVIPKRSEKSDPFRILDLGTGSGAIILSLAKERPGHLFFATDISVAALSLARENAMRNHLDRVVQFLSGFWLDAINPKVLFDVIVSNPPYIRKGDIETLEPEITRFEPFLALDGDIDGLASLRHIIQKGGPCLKPGGSLILEMGDGQAKDVDEIIKKTGLYSQPSFHEDLAGKIRVARMETIRPS